MSWWVSLNESGSPVDVENFQEGGTQVLGGTTDADLNITYNYSKFYYEFLDKEQGLRWLNNKKANECIERLKIAVKELGIEKDVDYWKSTPGNAGYALNILLKWAESNPQTIFRVD